MKGRLSAGESNPEFTVWRTHRHVIWECSDYMPKCREWISICDGCKPEQHKRRSQLYGSQDEQKQQSKQCNCAIQHAFAHTQAKPSSLIEQPPQGHVRQTLAMRTDSLTFCIQQSATIAQHLFAAAEQYLFQGSIQRDHLMSLPSSAVPSHHGRLSVQRKLISLKRCRPPLAIRLGLFETQRLRSLGVLFAAPDMAHW